MKVLKSGIEMTPKELQKAKGGMCACGCEGGYNGEHMWTCSDSGGGCMCGCTTVLPGGDEYVWRSPSGSAYNYLL